ncbi:MAG: hypothetical protein U1E38_08965 [Rhodospirillales bacterium]
MACSTLPTRRKGGQGHRRRCRRVRCRNGESTEAAIAKAREANGVARIVVQCAGIAPPASVVGRKGPHGLDLYAKVIGVNLIGIFNVMRLAAPTS